MKRAALRKVAIIGILVVAFTLVGACGRDGDRISTSDDASGSAGPLRVALLPVLDSLPFFVAEDAGYFVANRVDAEIVPVSSPVDRDQLFQAGAIDGMLNELSSTAVFTAAGVPIKTVLTVRKPFPGNPVFRILAAPDSGLTSVGDLRGVSIGVSMNTIIEYLTDRLLAAEGLPPDEIALASVPVIPERFSALLSGDLEAATLPDPLGAAAIRSGAVPIIDDSVHPWYSVSVLSFSADVLAARGDEVRGFVAAWGHAVSDLNGNPQGYRELFQDSVPMPASVMQTYEIPPFPDLEVPTAGQWNDVVDWLSGKGLIDTRPSYSHAVTSDYLGAGR